MKTSHIIGITILAVIWLILCFYMLSHAGVTLKNLLIMAMSGIIVFVPLYKKYRPTR